MDAIAKAPRQSFRMRGSSYVAFTFCLLGSVASGAEIVAGGSIHVYGALRGRAMAGSSGNAAARIFCQKIEAELLAINGYYQTAEEIDVALRIVRLGRGWKAAL
jgi:septum site-determining protein MinC